MTNHVRGMIPTILTRVREYLRLLRPSTLGVKIGYDWYFAGPEGWHFDGQVVEKPFTRTLDN
jgi:hypothetical protein